MEGYNANSYGYLKAIVVTVDKAVHKWNGQNYFCIVLRLNDEGETKHMQCGMTGTASILISDRSLMQYIMYSKF